MHFGACLIFAGVLYASNNHGLSGYDADTNTNSAERSPAITILQNGSVRSSHSAERRIMCAILMQNGIYSSADSAEWLRIHHPGYRVFSTFFTVFFTNYHFVELYEYHVPILQNGMTILQNGCVLQTPPWVSRYFNHYCTCMQNGRFELPFCRMDGAHRLPFCRMVLYHTTVLQNGTIH